MRLPELPITPSLPAISEALAQGHVVLSAPPGSGKTTLVPLALMDEAWLQGRRIVILEPRRPATRMAARRMASLLNGKVGEKVGYQVRFERRIGRDTRIEVITEGLLLRRLQQDPELSDVGLVIFDEFHERGLSGDLSLTLCLDVAQSLRPDLRLMPMSASLDGKALADRLGAAHLQSEGRSHPVQVDYLARDPLPEERIRQLAKQVREALAAQDGDLLVFLPGKGEIDALGRLLTETVSPDIEVRKLHSEVPAKEQDAIIQGGSARRRIILSTDIAETSLTIEGIGAVIDSGLNRKPRFDPGTGLTRLQTGFISQASALQRAGRAGRIGPGRCYRAWSEARQQRLEREIRPEIEDADLAGTALELAGWGINDWTQLIWVTPPPAAHWQKALELLRQLAAVDNAGRITPSGQAMLQLPLHPRLAHLLVTAKGKEMLQLGADISALLGERDPLERSARGTAGSDIRGRLQALSDFRNGRHPADFHRDALRRIDQAARQLLSLRAADTQAEAETLSPGLLLAMAFPDRIAKARAPGSPHYLLRSGRAASLPAHDPLIGTPYLVAAALDAGSRQGRIWLAAPLEPEEIETHFATQISEQRESDWDNAASAVRVWERRRLGALVVSEQNARISAEDDTLGVMLQQVRSLGFDLFDQAPALRRLQSRSALLRRHGGNQAWPDLSDEALLAQLDDWLAPWLHDIHSLKRLRALDLVSALAPLLDWEQQQRMQKLLPETYTTPAGTRRAIEYPAGEDPVLRVPLQEMLGAQQGPVLADGKVPVVLHLLSPAMRPIQITRDLVHFWGNAYAEVRKEMRGRYPKHHWPEDPANAQATRLGRRRPHPKA